MILCLSSVCLFGRAGAAELPEKDARPSVEMAVSDTAVFRFMPGRTMFFADYGGNRQSIEQMRKSIEEHKDAILAGNEIVRILGYCKSFGSEEENLAAAKNRSNQVKSYYIVHCGLKEENYRTTNSASLWNGQEDVIAVTYVTSYGSDVTGPEAIEVSASEPVSAADTSGIGPAPEVVPEAAPESDPIPTSVPQPEPAPEDDAEPAGEPYRWAVKTNVAYLGATVANLGAEYSLGEHWTVDLPVAYSPYTVSRTWRMRFLTAQPEVRYWIGKALEGHFFGVHLNIGAFNVSVDEKTRYQSPDGFYGAGLSYGYSLPFCRHWAAEFTIGAGYAYTSLDKYYNIPNGARYEQDVPCHYWGLTKVGISLVYRFGK